MRYLVLVTTLVGVARLAGSQPALPDVNVAEFKCMYGSAKAEAKFAVAKTKCVNKCFAIFWKGVGAVEDCLAPYGGATATCIDDPVSGRGAENKLQLGIEKYCVLARGADCPECYGGGNCTVAAADRVQERETIVDALIPAIICETAGAEPIEQTCQLQTAKALAKYEAAATTCYAKCFADARSNAKPIEDCLPPVANSRWFGCLTSARAKASATIHKYCHETSIPAAPPECGATPYPEGDQWVATVDDAVENLILPTTFCASPSGAFVD